MSKENFRNLIDRICEIGNIPDPALMYEMANLEIDGIPFTLMDGGAIEEGSLIYFCDFGEVPEENRTEVLQRLLEVNLILLGAGSPSFSINFQTGHVVLMGRVVIEAVPAQSLMDGFARHASQAKQWRKTYFLFDEDGEFSSLAQPRTQNALQEIAARTRHSIA